MEIMDKSKYLMPENSGYHIYAFMLNNLNLSGHELNVYALIYGFSMSGQGCFWGSREYLSACTNASLPTIDRVLKSLVKKGLINKTSSITNRGITPIYSANMEKIKEIQSQKNDIPKIDYCQRVYQNDKGVYQNDKGVYQNDKGVYQNDKQYNRYIEDNTLSCPTAELDQEMAEEERERVSYTSSSKPKNQEFTPPTLEQVLAYIEEKKLNTDGEEFYDYYAGVGWISGKKKIVDWKAVLRQWAKKHQKEVLTRTSYGYAPVEFNNF